MTKCVPTPEARPWQLCHSASGSATAPIYALLICGLCWAHVPTPWCLLLLLQALLDQMPHSLRRAVLSDINKATLRRTPVFFGCPKIVDLVCLAMRRTTCLSGDRLAKVGDVATELYILENG